MHETVGMFSPADFLFLLEYFCINFNFFVFVGEIELLAGYSVYLLPAACLLYAL